MSLSQVSSTTHDVTIADADLKRASETATYLKQAGFRASPLATERALIERVAQLPSVILLDMSLPEGDGLDLCLKLRHGGYHGGLILTKTAGTEVDLVAGLDAGADDYIIRPLRLDELPARINAVARRVRRQGQLGILVTPGGLRIDVATGVCRFNQIDLGLGPRQRDIIVRLAMRHGEAIPRPQLARGGRASLDVAIRRLRVRMEQVGVPEQIVNVPGYGFSLRSQSGTSDPQLSSAVDRQLDGH